MATKSTASSELTRGKRIQRNAYFSLAASVLLQIVTGFFAPFYVQIIFLFFEIIAAFVLVAVPIADKAEKKGRSWNSFFALSIVLSPLLMWIIVEAISPLPGSVAYSSPELVTRVSVAPDLTEQIKKLGDLRDQGLITDQDFEAKKNELLNRI